MWYRQTTMKMKMTSMVNGKFSMSSFEWWEGFFQKILQKFLGVLDPNGPYVQARFRQKQEMPIYIFWYVNMPNMAVYRGF